MNDSFDLEGRRVAIIGMAESGRAAARLAIARGAAAVYASDVGADARLRRVGAELRELGADAEVGGHDVARIAAADVVVVSPGIPPDAPVLRKLRSRRAGWISELEFAFRLLGRPLIAITGTNGKTTTAALAAHLLRTAGVDAVLAGNVGASLGPALSEVALRDPLPEWAVVEASSFQLRDTDRFDPEVGVLTNLAPDHMDVYGSVDEYYADKSRLFHHADAGSRWVLNGEDAAVRELADDAPGRRLLFGGRTAVAGADDAGILEDDGTLVLRQGGREEPLLDAGVLRLAGRHNAMNALAATLAATAAGVPSAPLAPALRSFEPLPHRLETVCEVDGVRWVNDSKATNVASARVGIRSVERPAVVLLGGKDKGEEFSELAPVLEARARAAVVYGAARHRLQEELAPALGAAVEVVRVDGSFADAVDEARRRARSGDVILLSPACSSYDMFGDFEERGRRFSELARKGA